RQTMARAEILGSLCSRTLWVLDRLGFIEDRVVELDALEKLQVAPEQRVASDDDVRVTELFFLFLSPSTVPKSDFEGGRETFDFALPIGNYRSGRYDECLNRAGFF